MAFPPAAARSYAADGEAQLAPSNREAHAWSDREFDEDIQNLHATLQGQSAHARLDAYDVLAQSPAPAWSKLEAARIRTDNLSLIFTNSIGQARSPTLYRRQDAREGLSPASADSTRLRIGFRDRPLLDVFVQKAGPAIFFDRFVVFTQAEGFDAQSGTHLLSYLDLETYRNCWGRGIRVPIFKLPVLTQAPISRLWIEGGKLRFWSGEGTGTGTQEVSAISPEAFRKFNEGNLSAIDVEAALLDPATRAAALPMVQELADTLYQAMDGATDSLVQQELGAIGGPSGLRAFLQTHAARLRSDPAELSASPQVVAMHEDFARNEKLQRKLVSRLVTLYTYLSLPQPMAGEILGESLAFLDGNFDPGARTSVQALREGTLELARHPLIQYGAPLAAASVLGALYPHAVGHYIYAALDIGKTVTQAAFGRAYQFGQLSARSFDTVFSWTHYDYAVDRLRGTTTKPWVVTQNLVANGGMEKIWLGTRHYLGYMYGTLGISFLAANTARLVVDLRGDPAYREFLASAKSSFQQAGSGVGVIQNLQKSLSSLRDAFIARQNHEEKQLIKDLSERSATAGGTGTAFTPEQDARAEEIVAELRARDTQSGLGELLKKVKELPFFSRFQTAREVDSFGTALRSFLIGQPAFKYFGAASNTFWGRVSFGGRSFLFKPRLLATYLAFPNFMMISARKRGQLTIPTDLNGGYDTLADSLRKAFTTDSERRRLDAFQEKIIEVETAIHREALAKSFSALTRYIGEGSGGRGADIRRLIAAGGITGVNADALEALDASTRAFFRNYFDSLFSQSFEQYLRAVITEDANDTTDLTDLSDAAAVQAALPGELGPSLERLAIDPAQARAIVEQNATDELFQGARPAKNFFTDYRTAKNQFKYSILKAIEGNHQIQRMLVSERQAKDPRALARSTRGLMMEIFYDRPVDFLQSVLFLSGVTGGLLKIVQPEMFGPNSAYWMPRMVVGSYLTASFISVLSYSWGKLYQDSLHSEDELNRIPAPEEVEGKSFNQYFMSKYRDPDNSLYKNQRHFLRNMFANVPNYLATCLLTMPLYLGRIDADTILNEYLQAVLIWNTGWTFKLENSYELSQGYFLGSIPLEDRHLIPHEAIQKYYLERSISSRFKFNIVAKFAEDAVAHWRWLLEMISTPELGPRGFSRVFTGGYTWTGLIKLASETAQKATRGVIPGAPEAIHACEKLFLNNFTDLKDGK